MWGTTGQGAVLRYRWMVDYFCLRVFFWKVKLVVCGGSFLLVMLNHNNYGAIEKPGMGFFFFSC